MPHLFVNRKRVHNLVERTAEPLAHVGWERANAILYEVGGVVFVVGSVLFFPRFAALADAGAWTFFAGSLLYLVVTVHDMAEALRYRGIGEDAAPESGRELVAAAAYLLGTVLFTVGSVLFLSWIAAYEPAAWCFVVGSVLFTLGACINVLQIVEARSLVTLQLMNLTAISFVVGSVLFALASVPYLWHVESVDDRHVLYAFLASQYVIGSVLFLVGGVFNHRRATLVSTEEAARPGSATIG